MIIKPNHFLKNPLQFFFCLILDTYKKKERVGGICVLRRANNYVYTTARQQIDATGRRTTCLRRNLNPGLTIQTVLMTGTIRCAKL